MREQSPPVARLLQIGQVAEMTGLSLKTIRHYDATGLVRPSGRSPGGFRLYSGADVDRLLVIRRMKPLGFTLEEMRDLLAALTVLDRPDGDERIRADAAAFIDQCSVAAQQRCRDLRQQLSYAEEFAGILVTTVRQHAPAPRTERYFAAGSSGPGLPCGG